MFSRKKLRSTVQFFQAFSSFKVENQTLHQCMKDAETVCKHCLIPKGKIITW